MDKIGKGGYQGMVSGLNRRGVAPEKGENVEVQSSKGTWKT